MDSKTVMFPRQRGASLPEGLMAMLIGLFAVGTGIIFLSRTSQLVSSNVSYAALQRSVLSSVESLPKPIFFAAEVEIIADAEYPISDEALDAGWRYVALKDGFVRHIGRNGTEQFRGPERIGDLRFTADVFPAGGEGGRLLCVHVTARNDHGKTLNMSRFLMVRARHGISGLDGASLPNSFHGGALLRYRL